MEWVRREREFEHLQAAARERWEDQWTIEAQFFADGDALFYAVHVEPTSEPDREIRDRLFIGSDGELYQDRIEVQKERVVDVIERDSAPEGVASRVISDE